MQHRRSLILALAVAAGIAPSAYAQSLTTALANNGSGGVFMDLAAVTPLNLTSIDTYFSVAAGNRVSVQIWKRLGAYAGLDGVSSQWELHETVGAIAAGPDTPTPLTLGTPLFLRGGSTTAVYLHSISGTAGIRYTGLPTAPPLTVWFGANLSLFSDVARTGPLAFNGVRTAPRTFAGTVHYAPANPLATGACCFSNGTCQVITAQSCAQGGVFRGAGTTCAQAACPQPGACCITFDCVSALQSECFAIGGAFRGPGTTCGGDPCFNEIAYAIGLNNRHIPSELGFFYPTHTYGNFYAPSFRMQAMDIDGSTFRTYGITDEGNPPIRTPRLVGGPFGDFSTISPIMGAGASEVTWSGMTLDPIGGQWFACAVAPGSNNLYTIDVSTGITTLVGSMGGDWEIVDIAADASGNLFAHDVATDSLLRINRATGAATVVGPTGLDCRFGQGMDFDHGTNTLYATFYMGNGEGYVGRIDTATGRAMLMSQTSTDNVQLEMTIYPINNHCYPNCDYSGNQPILNVADFTCFLQRFAAGSLYANCDGSSTQPVLNVADFTCFLQEFAAGCP